MIFGKSHRPTEVKSDLWRSSSPAPPIKAGSALIRLLRALYPLKFWIPLRAEIPSFLVEPIPVFNSRIMNWFSPDISWNFLCYNLCPLLLRLSLCTSEGSLAQFPLWIPIILSKMAIISPLNLLLSWWWNPALLAFHWLSSALACLLINVASVGLAALCQHPSWAGVPKMTQHSKHSLTSAKQRRIITPNSWLHSC